MNLSCYLVDDEYHALNLLKEFIDKTPGIELAGCSTSATTALSEITNHYPMLVFLDIDMPDLNGLSFAEIIGGNTTVIFTTAHPEYAAEAFEKDAADYLLKPISYERFLKCITKIRRRLAGDAEKPAKISESFFVKTGIRGKLTSINPQEIKYIKASLNYIEILLRDRKVVTYLTMTEAGEKLGATNFSRVHKSYLVNHDFIRSVDYSHIILNDNTVIPIGRAYRKSFNETWNHSLRTI
jgi:DNA-binding LytR/AlgR family response regulator